MITRIKSILRPIVYSPSSPFVLSVIVGIIIYAFSQVPFTNLIITVDIGIGLYWLVIAATYGISASATLYVALGMWIVSWILVLFGAERLADIAASNVYLLLIIAFFQQVREHTKKRNKS